MVVNGKTILSLIDRVTPYIKKRVKSTIYLKTPESRTWKIINT